MFTKDYKKIAEEYEKKRKARKEKKKEKTKSSSSQAKDVPTMAAEGGRIGVKTGGRAMHGYGKAYLKGGRVK